MDESNPYDGIYAPVRQFEVKVRGENAFLISACRITYNSATKTKSLQKGPGVTVFSASESDILYIRAVD